MYLVSKRYYKIEFIWNYDNKYQKAKPALTCMPEKKVRRRPFGKRKGLQGPNSGRTQAKSVPEREKHTLVGMAQNRPEADGSQE